VLTWTRKDLPGSYLYEMIQISDDGRRRARTWHWFVDDALLQPLAADHAMHPVQFGIMMIVNLEIGYLTPPMGLNLIVAMAAFRESFWTVCRAMPIFVLLMLVGLAAVAWFPPLSLFALE